MSYLKKHKKPVMKFDNEHEKEIVIISSSL